MQIGKFNVYQTATMNEKLVTVSFWIDGTKIHEVLSEHDPKAHIFENFNKVDVAEAAFKHRYGKKYKEHFDKWCKENT